MKLAKKLVALLAGRVADSHDVLTIYAVIVFLVYSWTLMISFQRLSSWAFYLDVLQIASIYAYAFLFNFAESLMVLAFILFLEFTVFLNRRKSVEFRARGVIAVLFLLGSITLRLVRYNGYQDVDAFVSGQILWWAFTLVTGLLLAVNLPKIEPVRNLVGNLADRAIVFLYIYPPLSFISLIVVILRNIV